MKRTDRLNQRRSVAAFTLIELLVVIAIIGILAGLVFPVVGVVNRNKQLSLAKAQLQQIQQAIEGYHTKLGYYPPDNTNNPALNPLYFELMGTTNDGAGKPAPTTWGTLDGSAQIALADLNNLFNLTGLANTSTRAHSDDQGAAATTFLTHLLPNQVAPEDTSKPQILALVSPVVGYPVLANTTVNPWRYNSSHPTNNVGGYDLWIDLVIRGKTNRVCNWSANPIQL